MLIEIGDIGFGGKGVGRLESKVVFVPFVIDGEQVEVAITRDRGRFAEAELKSVVRTSPHRVDPPCRYFGTCGGCAYQHVAYPHQLEIKRRQVESLLRRVGRLADPVVAPTVASPAPFAYRNRIRVHCADGAIGFVARDQRTLVDIEACAIASENVNAQLAQFRAEKRPKWDGDRTFSDRGARFFEQTNDAVADLLTAHIAAAATVAGGALIDAYCGGGLFAKALADRYEKIVGIESNPRAVAEARASATERETYLEGDVETLLEFAFEEAGELPVTLLVDPPAAGLTARVADLIAAFDPAEVFYVSCDPATLARDLGRLTGSHALVAAQPFDMFPQTAEIEVVAHLVRREKPAAD